MTPSPAKRYFYSDRLAAAWMEQHCNMVFTLEMYYNEIMVAAGLDEFDDFKFATSVSTYCLRDGNAPGKILVHPDSLHLLKPQVGDLVRIQWLDESVSHRHWDAFDEEPEAGLDRDIRVQPIIIQRNGKPFFWPESEAA